MLKLIKRWSRGYREVREHLAIEDRNEERRKLCTEYRRNKTRIGILTARQGEVIARLAELSGEANLEAVTARLSIELEGIDRRAPQAQAEALREYGAVFEESSHLTSDMRRFRQQFCGTIYPDSEPRGVVEDDAGLPVEVKA